MMNQQTGLAKAGSVDLFETFRGYERVVFCRDTAVGLEAIIAIHSTRNQRSLGGCRMWPYPTFKSAIEDTLKRATAATYQSALYHLPFGGAAALILGDPRTDKSEEMILAFAREVNRLGGQYCAIEDAGLHSDDLLRMRAEIPARGATPQGLPFTGESLSYPTPADATAEGLFWGMRACLEEVFGSASLSGKRVAIQGFGKVGFALAQRLHAHGAVLYISDMDPERIALGDRAFGAIPLLGHEIYRVDCDIYAPCGLGGTLNERTLPRLSCLIVAGGASGQLASEEVDRQIAARGILYAPDFVINAGHLLDLDREKPETICPGDDAKMVRIYDQLKRIFSLSKTKSMTTGQAAVDLAKERIHAGGDAHFTKTV